jgi:hypothetical protein
MEFPLYEKHSHVSASLPKHESLILIPTYYLDLYSSKFIYGFRFRC